MSDGYRPADYVPLPEAVAAIGCSRQTVYLLIKEGKLNGVQLRDNGWWKVQRRSLKEYLQRLGRPGRGKKR